MDRLKIHISENGGIDTEMVVTANKIHPSYQQYFTCYFCIGDVSITPPREKVDTWKGKICVTLNEYATPKTGIMLKFTEQPAIRIGKTCYEGKTEIQLSHPKKQSMH